MVVDPSRLSGTVYPGFQKQVVFLTFPDDPVTYLPCFSSAQLLFDSMDAGGIQFDHMQVVVDVDTFWAEIQAAPVQIKVILDLHADEFDRLQYIEVDRLLN